MFVFGGPAYISVRQDMATRIQFNESYPYDSATFTGVETASVSGGGVGATAGVDVSYLAHEARSASAANCATRTHRPTLTPSTQPANVGARRAAGRVRRALLF